MRPKQFLYLFKDAIIAWQDDYAPSMGAAIAFYTVFSITPLLVIVIAVAGVVWGHDAVQGEVIRQLSGLVGQDGAAGVQQLIKSADDPAEGFTASIISVVVLAVGATSVLSELQSALDRIWKIPANRTQKGLWHLVRTRLLSFGMVLGLGFLMLVSLIVSAVLAAVGRWVGGIFSGWELLLQGLNTLASLSIATVLFAMIFKFMPQAKIVWRDVWTGAIVTAVLFEVGKVLIGLYVGKSATISSLTAAGSLVVVLIWVYYAAQVFLLGAEFTWKYATQYGSCALQLTEAGPSEGHDQNQATGT